MTFSLGESHPLLWRRTTGLASGCESFSSLLNFSFQVTATLKKRMMMAGTLMVSYQPLGKTPNFFRSIISNPATREEDIDFMLDEMERLGSDL